MNYKILFNSNILSESYQLKLPLELDFLIPKDDSVRVLNWVIDSINLSNLEKTYSRKPNFPISTMLKIVIYANMNKIYSSREIEKACRRDINFMYLLGGASVPDHSTIARFRANHSSKVAKDIMTQINELLFKIGEINQQTIYIDGTKIESAANRYTFVWKKAVNKNHEKLMAKIPNFIKNCEKIFDFKIRYKDVIKIKHLKKLMKKLRKIAKDNKVEFVHGKGKRKSQIQKSIETLESYISRLKMYNNHLFKMGTRNSYSKTDNDATFMRMKEDHMKNGQLKLAYNIQAGIDSSYITWIGAFSNPTDTNTLKSFLNDFDINNNFRYKNIVADAGYESEENYVYLKNNNQISYIKTLNYETKKKKSHKNNIGLAENMEYISEEDCYICKNNRRLNLEKEITRKTATGYQRKVSIYSCSDCSNCELKRSCIKNNGRSKIPFEDRIKRMEISKTFVELRNENLDRITSDIGIEFRKNRSIQAEGAFAQIKNNMGFRRFLSKGKNNVLTECIILALACNINKLHKKIFNL